MAGGCVLNSLLKSSGLSLGGLSKTSKSTLLLNSLQTYPIISSRSTFVFKRVHPLPKMHPNSRKPPRLKSVHYLYDVIQDRRSLRKEQQDIQVILVKYVEGLGKAGDIVTVNPNVAYNNLLLPKLAIYASPENLARASMYKVAAEEEEFSSKTSKTLMRKLPYHTIPVVMNKDLEWTIQPWHIRASARKAGIHILHEKSIEIPGPPIQGPDMDLHGKDFLVILTVNNKEKIKMRCKILLWATKAAERLPIENQFWCVRGEPVHPEEAEDLGVLPIEPFNPDKVNIPSRI